jgi:hypothetical protein
MAQATPPHITKETQSSYDYGGSCWFSWGWIGTSRLLVGAFKNRRKSCCVCIVRGLLLYALVTIETWRGAVVRLLLRLRLLWRGLVVLLHLLGLVLRRE